MNADDCDRIDKSRIPGIAHHHKVNRVNGDQEAREAKMLNAVVGSAITEGSDSSTGWQIGQSLSDCNRR